MFDFSLIRRSVSSLGAQIQKMQSELDQLRRQRESILSAASSKDDLKSLLKGWVAAQGDKYHASLRATLTQFRNPRNLTAGDLARVMSLSGAAQPHGDTIRAADVDQALCALFGPLVQDALLTYVERMEWPEHTISTADRQAQAAKLEAQIVDLQKSTDELIKAADEAGINWSRP